MHILMINVCWYACPNINELKIETQRVSLSKHKLGYGFSEAPIIKKIFYELATKFFTCKVGVLLIPLTQNKRNQSVDVQERSNRPNTRLIKVNCAKKTDNKHATKLKQAQDDTYEIVRCTRTTRSPRHLARQPQARSCNRETKRPRAVVDSSLAMPQGEKVASAIVDIDSHRLKDFVQNASIDHPRQTLRRGSGHARRYCSLASNQKQHHQQEQPPLWIAKKAREIGEALFDNAFKEEKRRPCTLYRRYRPSLAQGFLLKRHD